MKIAPLTLSVLFTLSLTACSTKMSKDNSFSKIENNYQKYQNITEEYNINTTWWKEYQDSQLNKLIETALTENKDLAKSAILVNKALFNANLLGANLVPNFSLNGQSSAQRAVKNPAKKPYSTNHSLINHNIGLNLSYTLDLWQRLANTSSAAQWQKEATAQDLESTKLVLVHSIIDLYYRLAYLNQMIQITHQTKQNYQKISNTVKNKYRAGLITSLNVDQANLAVLQTQEKLLDLKLAQKQTEQALRNLLNLTPNQPLAIHYPKLLNVAELGVDLNVPLSSIANRPDLKSALYRFKSSFKQLQATEMSWYPNITLGSTLSSNASLVNDLTNNSIWGGLLSFNLPFLDWQRVKAKINLSEQDYQLAKINYEQKVTKALNEINVAYYSYKNAKQSFKNQQKINQYNQNISRIYKNRYTQGVIELSKWLNAVNTANNSKLALIQAKYDILKNESSVYQVMAGKYNKVYPIRNH